MYFIPCFATIVRPLPLLTQNGALKLKWCMQCEQAFQTLKRKLTVLAYPQAKHLFIIETGASGGELGVVLCQMQADSTVHPIAYASRS